MKVPKKKALKAVIYGVVLVLYLLSSLFIFNLREYIRFGYYDEEQNLIVEFSEGTGGVKLEFYAHHQAEMSHGFGINLKPIASGSVEYVGISRLSYKIETSAFIKQIIDQNYSVPKSSYSFFGITRLEQNDNLTLQGFADVILTVDNVNETHRLSFDKWLFIAYYGPGIDYNWNIANIWLVVIYIGILTIPVAFTYRSIQAIRFTKWYTEDMKERDEKFFRILSKTEKPQQSD